jgi:hypothetical protein
MMGYIIKGNLNIRIHRDITGEMGVGVEIDVKNRKEAHRIMCASFPD